MSKGYPFLPREYFSPGSVCLVRRSFRKGKSEGIVMDRRFNYVGYCIRDNLRFFRGSERY